MGIELFWMDEEEKVFLVEFDGKWSWDELHKIIRKTQDISDQRGEAIGAIIDLRKGASFPNGSLFSAETRDKFKELLQINNHGNQHGPLAVVGAYAIIKPIIAAVNIVDSSATKDVFVARTMDEAKGFMRKRLNLPRAKIS